MFLHSVVRYYDLFAGCLSVVGNPAISRFVGRKMLQVFVSL
jgi:hypothetical protein